MSLTTQLKSQIREELELLSRKNNPYTIGSIKSIGIEKVIEYIAFNVANGLSVGKTISQAIDEYESDLQGGDL
jgi:hypothetical protein